MRMRAIFIAALASSLSVSGQTETTPSLPAAVRLKIDGSDVDRIVYGDKRLYECVNGELKQYRLWQVVQGFDPGSTDAIALYCDKTLVEVAGGAAFLENWSKHGGFVIWDDGNRAMVPFPPIRPAAHLKAATPEEQREMVLRLTGTTLDPIRRGAQSNVVLHARVGAGGVTVSEIRRAMAQSFYQAPAFSRGRVGGIVTVDEGTVSITSAGTGHRFLFEVDDVNCRNVAAAKHCSYRFRFGTQVMVLSRAMPTIFDEWR